jgi:hypothetical protein
MPFGMHSMRKGWTTIRFISAWLVAVHFVSGVSLAQDPSLILGVPACTNGEFHFTLNGQYGVRYVIEASDDFTAWTPVLTNDGPDSIRTFAMGVLASSQFYRARRVPSFYNLRGLIARTNIIFKGTRLTVDSFDSSDTVSFPGGRWNATNQRANGNVMSSYGTISVGNAAIMGKLFARTTGDVSIQANGSVGDVAWVTNGLLGIESGWLITNSPVIPFSDAVVPTATWLPATGSGTNTYALSSGNYEINGDLVVPSGQRLLVYASQSAVLYVTGNVQIGGSIDITPGARLTLYVGGASTSLSQVNNAGTSSSFMYYGLPGNTNITCSASAIQYVGDIYAPNATFNVSGGGDFQGAWVVNEAALNGQVNFHVDESQAWSPQ